ncbi:hypothetical protein [Solirubrum puertoriconensis]|uniref:Lipoprotein n=1 Tax=Solirubrum puertoriconensis TaxID=1751427 RepID=A0A9X0HJ82_SOLP1|nr:hypothetical protein [Solirubrum puertoriconensis]KUG06871.1 hypothetical protein ASU33_05980 [Solirubrum puertoriconensis]
MKKLVLVLATAIASSMALYSCQDQAVKPNAPTAVATSRNVEATIPTAGKGGVTVKSVERVDAESEIVQHYLSSESAHALEASGAGKIQLEEILSVTLAVEGEDTGFRALAFRLERPDGTKADLYAYYQAESPKTFNGLIVSVKHDGDNSGVVSTFSDDNQLIKSLTIKEGIAVEQVLGGDLQGRATCYGKCMQAIKLEQENDPLWDLACNVNQLGCFLLYWSICNYRC